MLLHEQHDRGSFTCGVESLDRYLKTQAGQDVRRKANAVFVLVERDDPARILGYYTLCAIGIAQGEVPEAARKDIPRYPLMSATLIVAWLSRRTGRDKGWVRSCWPTRCGARSRAPARSDLLWSWSMLWTRRRPASTPRMGSCDCPIHFGWCCRCVLQVGWLNDDVSALRRNPGKHSRVTSLGG